MKKVKEKKRFLKIKNYVEKVGKIVDGDLRDLMFFFSGSYQEDNISLEIEPCKEKRFKVPVYLTKSRVKEVESVYLKTKRRSLDLSDFQDVGGLRLLCLFEKDIYDVFRYFLTLFDDDKYEFIDCKVYNWSDSVVRNRLNLLVARSEVKKKIKFVKKLSGYKSIHCIVKRKASGSLPIEIQIRTLLQDVWGELEHALSYKKGSVHPHIKKSFYLLSKDLQNADDLLSHLRDISDKERCGEKYMNYKVGPKYLFTYENKMLPDIFKKKGSLHKEYEIYWNEVQKYDRLDKSRSVVKSMRDNYEKINEMISAQKYKELGCVNYWCYMEEAFLLFCEAKYEDAISKYKEVLKDYEGRYCAYYRLGEIYFLLGYVEKALEAFDEAEYALIDLPQEDYHNHYRIKSRLAMAYWYLGDEYIDIAVEEIDDAFEIYDAHRNDEFFDDVVSEQLTNNVCWYYLERYIVSVRSGEKAKIRNKCFEDVKEKYALLKKYVDSEAASSNTLDTAAWYYYNSYLKTKKLAYLEKAKKLCLKMKNRKSYTYYGFTSLNLHNNHIKEIMST